MWNIGFSIFRDEIFNKVNGVSFVFGVMRDINLCDTENDFRFEREIGRDYVAIEGFSFEMVVKKISVDY